MGPLRDPDSVDSTGDLPLLSGPRCFRCRTLGGGRRPKLFHLPLRVPAAPASVRTWRTLTSHRSVNPFGNRGERFVGGFLFFLGLTAIDGRIYKNLFGLRRW